MDPNRDNPIIRFTAFWWGIGIILIFALLLAVIALSKGNKPETIEDVVAKARYTTKEKINAEQAANLPQEKIAAAIPQVAAKLAASKPAPVEKPEQVVPGTPTAAKLAAAPAVDTTKVDVATPPAEAAPVDPAVMALGKAQFLVCSACHGQNGEGSVTAPPLAGSNWVTGPVSNLIRIQFRGLQGPITVSGKEYNFPAPMAALGAANTDENIAAVLTYVRNSFGNKASAVKPEQVAALRSEVGKPPLTAQDLKQP